MSPEVTPARAPNGEIRDRPGVVIRSMSIVVTNSGASPITTTRREVVTCDGSDTAKIVITQDGETKNCTLPLPRGRITCS